MSRGLTAAGSVNDRIADPVHYALTIGTAMAKSGMFGLNNVESGQVVALTCLFEGISPLQYGRKYHTVQGKPSMRADAMLAEFRLNGGKHKVVRRDSEGASVLLTTPDGESQEFSFTWEEAQQEDFVVGKDGGIKDNYAYPRKRMQMLWARVVSDGVRTLAPEIVYGIYTPEETQDFDAPAKVVQRSLSDSPVAQAALPPVAKPVDEIEDVPFETDDKATDLQVSKIEMLIASLGMPSGKVVAMLEKRGVNSVEDLTKDQADEILMKLESLDSAK